VGEGSSASVNCDVVIYVSGSDVIYANKPGHSTVSPGSGTNWVDVGDSRGDDRMVCASGSVNYIRVDRSDQISRSCRGKGSISYVGVR
jgi:hypothetical protein